MKKKDSFLVLFIFIFLTVLIFRNYFFKGQIPFPANLLVSFYSPWRYYEWEGYPNGPPNKPIGFDVVKLFYPYRKFTVDQLKSNQWPLWNPYNFSGNIHLATYQAAVFYPLNFLYFVLPLIDAWSWLVVLQPILAGLFMYLFLKEINLSRKAAFFGAFAFAFSGWMLAWMEESLVIEHSALWLPLILYGVEKLRKKISAGRIVLLILAATASVLAGFLQLTLYSLVTVLAWILFRFWPFQKKNLKNLFVLGLSFFFSFLISAVHLGPAIEAYFTSPRGLVNAKFLFDEYLMPLWHLVTFLAPDFWGNPGAYNYFGDGFYHERVIYLGIPVLLFSLSAFWLRQKNRNLRFFKWFSLITLGLGFFPLGWLLYLSRLPLLTVMTPSRIFFLSTFGFCTLAAFGIDSYFKHPINWKRWRNLFLVISLIFFLLWFLVFGLKSLWPKEKYVLVSLRNLVLPTGFFLSSVGAILFPWLKGKIKFLAKLSLKKARYLSFLVLVFLSVFSSLYFANKFLYFSERKFVFPEVAVITKLKEIAGLNRIWGYGDGHLEKNMNIYYGLYSPEGYDALFSQRYGELLHAQKTEGEITSQITRTDANIKQLSDGETVLDDWYRRRLLSLLGVKYIIESKSEREKWERWLRVEEKESVQTLFRSVWEDEKFKIWEYSETLPRAFLVDDYLVETDKQKIVNYLFDKNFDLRKRIVLEEEPDLKIDQEGKEGKKEVKIVKYLANRVELTVDSSTPALLFLSDNYYPGWQASIDGRETEILRANYSFRALPLPEGKHQIVFSYQPKVFSWSLKTSLVSLVFLIGWLSFGSRISLPNIFYRK